MKQQGIVRGLVLTVLMVALAACDSPSDLGTADSEGRKRLSVNNSAGEFGNYVVRINAMTTSDLSTDVAQSYGITRSDSSGLVNLVVLQKSDETGLEMPVRATVNLSAANLTGQVKSVELQEVVDGQSVYYIGVVSIDDREMINFDFDIVPEGSPRSLPVRFSHKFYGD